MTGKTTVVNEKDSVFIQYSVRFVFGDIEKQIMEAVVKFATEGIKIGVIDATRVIRQVDGNKYDPKNYDPGDFTIKATFKI